MADTSPVVTAHHHARNAGRETAQSHWDLAANEHTQAAHGYQRASRTTSDAEALRILKLLEQQHLKLAHIISTRDMMADHVKSEDADSEAGTPPKTPVSADTAAAAAAQAQSTTSKQQQHQQQEAQRDTPPKRLKPPMRESSPSLAREMASRRGIPPTRPAAARTSQLTPESQRRATAAQAVPRIPSSVMDPQTQALRKDHQTQGTGDEEGFSNFYSNLTTGTMSKLSSVLAYAGLPLTATAEESKDEDTQISKLLKRTVKADTGPDVKNIFSKAALNAIEDDHKQRGLQGQAFGPSESFYVVQTAGGTLSYADIARAQAQPSSIIGGDDEEAFVDAREAQPSSPRQNHGRSHSRRTSSSTNPQQQHQQANSRRDFGSARTAEELELENTTLKQTLEQLASRLANFEAHAQDASMAALTQSMANVRHVQGTPSAPAADAASQERIRALETRIEQQAEQREKLEELAKKQEKKIRAYHSKWEEIKKSAREKDKVKREKQGQDDGSPI